MKLPKTDLMYLSMAAFVFIASFSLWVHKKDSILIKNNILVAAKSESYPERPVQKNGTIAPSLTAVAALAVDAESGVILYEKNPDKELLPASTTKIITALVALDNYNLETVLTAPGFVVDGQKMGLVAGEKMSVRNLLYGLLVYSANDAAEMLAHSYCYGGECGRSEFIGSMNRKVSSLGLTNTRFTNPAGLDDNGHYSTARDLIKVAQVAMDNSIFAEIVGTKEIEVKSEDGKSHKLTNINELLGKEGVKGIKTGWTQNARENLVTYQERDGRRIMLAVLGSSDRFGETSKLIDWIYDSFEWQDVTYGAHLP